MLKRKAPIEKYNQFNKALIDNRLTDQLTITKNGLNNAYKHISPIIEKYRIKAKRNRYVDFNQGTDARYVTDDIMKKMSELPIKPLRIAFDYIGMRNQYEKAVRLAAKYGIRELSNYLLYNFSHILTDLFHNS